MKTPLHTLLAAALVALALCSCRPPDVSSVFGLGVTVLRQDHNHGIGQA